MKEHQTIFSVKEFKSKIKNAFVDGIPNKKEKIEIIENWQQGIISGKVINSKEEELKPFFLTQFFGDVLGYEYKNSETWNLRLENKSDFDSSKADAALGFFKIKEKQEQKKDVRVVIEIKDAKTTLDKPQNRPDFKGSPVEQCFMYAAKSGKNCKWVIVSNFLEIRLYPANDMTKYESFDILRLNDDFEFSKFYYLIANGQLFFENIKSTIDIALENRIEKEQTITREFYNEYSYLRETFLQHLKLHNADLNPLDLLQYAQTIIDRIIFVSVIKDYDLIQSDVLKRIEKIAEESWADDKTELWEQLKKFFKALDKGYPKRIHQINGGLFKQNEKIDNLIIKDVFLKKLLTLGNYDFESDLSINILGHIFEQSITDIENLKKDIAENKQIEYFETDDEILYKSAASETNKRKKDGIFYTPEKITQYIVSKAIGHRLDNHKEQLGINKLTNSPENLNEVKKHIEIWEKYITILKNIKILDPACGSGAFLTQAFDYLLQEWLIVTDVLQNLKNEKIKSTQEGIFKSVNQIESNKVLSEIKKDIVNNNLFGVDLNYESVEITKLGLWLKSASKNDALALLDSNIKTGNSLISDKEVSEKAFVWETEFQEILQNGGFDIILGNPPYVRQENLKKEEKQYFTNTYKQTGNISADLYIYFYEKAFELLKPYGILGFITPNKWFKTKYGSELRAFLKQFEIKQIIDFFELRVFEDAATDTQIIIVENNRQTKEFDYFPLTKLEVLGELKITPVKVNPVDFNGSEWIFAKPEDYKILKTMFKNSIPLNEYTKNGIEYGIKTGLNKAFIIDRDTKNIILKEDYSCSQLIKPYAVPTSIKKFYIEEKDEFFFINTGYDIEISNKSFKGVYNHLKQFDAELENRYDKGKTRYNLRACDYYDKFEQPKIIYIRTAVNHNFYFDFEKFYINDSCYIIANADKFLALWLNSKMFEFYKNLTFVAYGNPENKGRCKLDYNKMVDVPIPLISDKLRHEFEILYDKIFSLSQDLHKLNNSFIEIVKSQSKVKKVSKKVESWYSLNWDEFKEELEKLKIKLDLKKLKEWNEFFTGEQKTIIPIVNEINELTQFVDNKINEIYEIKI